MGMFRGHEFIGMRMLRKIGRSERRYVDGIKEDMVGLDMGKRLLEDGKSAVAGLNGMRRNKKKTSV